MIENAPIVKDIRNIREDISESFDNDLDRYADYLISKERNGLDESSSLDHRFPRSGRDAESVHHSRFHLNENPAPE
jgi:hypothetical protein